MTLRELQKRVNQLVAENDLSADGTKVNDLPIAACIYRIVNGQWVRDEPCQLGAVYRNPLTLKNGKQVVELTVHSAGF